MPRFECDLINVADGIHDHSRYPIEEQTAGSDWSLQMRRLHGGLSDGVDVIRLNNGRLCLEVIPTRGMGIWQGIIDGVRLGWDSPAQWPVHPGFVDPMRRGGIGWLDGFNELICRCGLGWHGAPGIDTQYDASGKVISEQFLPLHGRIANLPAHRVSIVQDDDAIQLTGIVDEGALFGGRLRLTSQLRTTIGSSRFELIDTVTNCGGTPADVEMLYHCNFGPPLLGDGATFHMAHAAVAPRDQRAVEGISDWSRFTAPEPGFAEQAYFTEPLPDSSGHALAVLASPGQEYGIGLRFDTSTLPWLTLWKNSQAEADGYVTGLEPGSSFPNGRQFERKNERVIRLQADQSVTFRLSLEFANGSAECRRLVDETLNLQLNRNPSVFDAPNPIWSPI